MKQKQQELERLKEFLGQKIQLCNKNKREKDHLVLEHCECLRKEESYSLDIKNLKHQIEEIEEEIKNQESYIGNIHRILPIGICSLYIEIVDDRGYLICKGVLHYTDMNDAFQVPRFQFNEGFIRSDLKGISWRINREYISYHTIEIPELMKLISI